MNVVVKEDGLEEKTHYSDIIIEEPDRCIQALYSLARGHALIMGRSNIDTCDLPVVVDVALSSAPWNRILTFAYLLTKKEVKTKDIMDDPKCSRNKAIRSMKTLELLDLVDLKQTFVGSNGGNQIGYIMTLKDEFNWFKSSEFMHLWRQKLEYPTKKSRNKPEMQSNIKLETFESVVTVENTLRPSKK